MKFTHSFGTSFFLGIFEEFQVSMGFWEHIFAVMLFACHVEDAKPGKGKGKQLPFPVKVVPLFRRLQEDLRAILFEPKVGVQCLASQPNSQHRGANCCALPLGKNASSFGNVG